MHERKGLPLHWRIGIGLLVGLVAGLACQFLVPADNEVLKTITGQYTKPFGSLFLNLITMVVVPLIFSALVLGVGEIGAGGKLGRIGLRSLGLTVLLSATAVGIGLAAVNIFRPGDGLDKAALEKFVDKTDTGKKVGQAKEAKGWVETIVDMVPKNPIDSAAKALDGGIMGVMFFAVMFGIALSQIGAEKAMPVTQFLEGLLAVSLRLVDMAMKFAPFGVAALIFTATATLGVAALAALVKYALVVLGALALHMFGVYSLVLKFVAKRSPLDFFRRIRPVMLTAFATSSSNATLPTALRSAEQDLALPRDISNFVLTVGATANQNGTALFEGITVLFLAQLFGIQLDVMQQVTVMGMAIVAGIGTAGVPGGSWPFIAIILASVGVPAEAIGLCLGVDRILDMSRTVLNVAGDMTIATCVAAMEGQPTQIIESAEG